MNPKDKRILFSLSEDLTKYCIYIMKDILKHTARQGSICSEQFKYFNLMLLCSFWILRKNNAFFFNIIFQHYFLEKEMYFVG